MKLSCTFSVVLFIVGQLSYGSFAKAENANESASTNAVLTVSEQTDDNAHVFTTIPMQSVDEIYPESKTERTSEVINELEVTAEDEPVVTHVKESDDNIVETDTEGISSTSEIETNKDDKIDEFDFLEDMEDAVEGTAIDIENQENADNQTEIIGDTEITGETEIIGETEVTGETEVVDEPATMEAPVFIEEEVINKKESDDNTIETDTEGISSTSETETTADNVFAEVEALDNHDDSFEYLIATEGNKNDTVTVPDVTEDVINENESDDNVTEIDTEGISSFVETETTEDNVFDEVEALENYDDDSSQDMVVTEDNKNDAVTVPEVTEEEVIDQEESNDNKVETDTEGISSIHEKETHDVTESDDIENLDDKQDIRGTVAHDQDTEVQTLIGQEDNADTEDTEQITEEPPVVENEDELSENSNHLRGSGAQVSDSSNKQPSNVNEEEHTEGVKIENEENNVLNKSMYISFLENLKQMLSLGDLEKTINKIINDETMDVDSSKENSDDNTTVESETRSEEETEDSNQTGLNEKKPKFSRLHILQKQFQIIFNPFISINNVSYGSSNAASHESTIRFLRQ